jgi:hypothetical protein
MLGRCVGGQTLRGPESTPVGRTAASKIDDGNAASSAEPTTKKRNFTSADKRISLVGIESGVARTGC